VQAAFQRVVGRPRPPRRHPADIDHQTRMDTPKSLMKDHQDARVSIFLLITPVSNPDKPNDANPFMMPEDVKMAAAHKYKDNLTDFLLKADYLALRQADHHLPFTAADVFEDGWRSVNVHCDDNHITGMYQLLVWQEVAEKLMDILRGGQLGYHFLSGLPRDEPSEALHAAIAVKKRIGRVYVMPAIVINEIWQQSRPARAYLVTNTRAFKGMYIYLCSFINDQHIDYALRNPITLLGNEKFDAFRYEPAKGVNTFFLVGASSVNDAHLRFKPGIAGLLCVKASQVRFFRVNDIVSQNVVVMRCEVPDDPATCAQLAALMSHGRLLIASKLGSAAITMASSLDELQNLIGHFTMIRAAVTSEPCSELEALGEEPERTSAAPGAMTPRWAEVDQFYEAVAAEAAAAESAATAMGQGAAVMYPPGLGYPPGALPRYGYEEEARGEATATRWRQRQRQMVRRGRRGRRRERRQWQRWQRWWRRRRRRRHLRLHLRLPWWRPCHGALGGGSRRRSRLRRRRRRQWRQRQLAQRRRRRERRQRWWRRRQHLRLPWWRPCHGAFCGGSRWRGGLRRRRQRWRRRRRRQRLGKGGSGRGGCGGSGGGGREGG